MARTLKSDLARALRFMSSKHGIVLAVVAVVVAMILMAISFQVNNDDAAGSCTGSVTHVVAPGDTLWDLTEAIPGSQEHDPRNIIIQIKAMNDLKRGAHLQLGTIKVPATCVPPSPSEQEPNGP